MSTFIITLQGFPEKVQQFADALDEAFPGAVAWVQSTEYYGETSIKIEGYEIPTQRPGRIATTPPVS